MNTNRLFLPILLLLMASRLLMAAPKDSLAFARTPDSVNAFFVNHMAYTLSFNYDYNIPNWVSHCLTRYEAENKLVKRSDKFRADPDVPNSPVKSDYSNSGYDRGHMAPSADMLWDSVAQVECFYMTNMCPQIHNLNDGCWGDLEEQTRTLAKRYDSLYVCSGPVIFSSGSTDTYIGSNRRILVPRAFFKVFLVKIDGQWNAIGFIFPHESRSGKVDFGDYCFSVDDVERITGLDFFYNLPDDIERRVESSYNYDLWK